MWGGSSGRTPSVADERKKRPMAVSVAVYRSPCVPPLPMQNRIRRGRRAIGSSGWVSERRGNDTAGRRSRRMQAWVEAFARCCVNNARFGLMYHGYSQSWSSPQPSVAQEGSSVPSTPQRAVHRVGEAVAHPRQDVAVHVERDGDVGVAEKLLDVFGMLSHTK